MTTIAFNQYCNISFIGGSYVSSPIQNGITMPQHPNDVQTRPVNNGVQSAKHSNPPKFGVSDSSASFAMGRRQYIEYIKGVTPVDEGTSGYLRRLKIDAIGESTLLADGQPLTYKSYNVNDVKNALAKARSHGYIAPAKKGALENPYMSGGSAKRGFLPPNTSANSAASKHSAFLSRHAKERLSCPVTNSTNSCLAPDPANIEGAVYSRFPPNHRNHRSTQPETPIDMSERVNSIFMPHYIRYQMACDDCPDYIPTVIAGTEIVVDDNKFSTALSVHVKDRIGCADC
jgi:hypothetical protein